MIGTRSLIVGWLVVVLGLVFVVPAGAFAEEADRNTVLEGQFVRRKEVRIGEGEFLALEINVPKRGVATVVVPRKKEELMNKARALKEGDRVRIEAVREGEYWWTRTLRNDGPAERDGDKPREGEGDKPRDGDAERPRDGDREREGDRPRDGDREREGNDAPEADRARVIEGAYAMPTAVEVGEREVRGLYIRVNRGDLLLVLVPRKDEGLQAQARRLKKDDIVRIEFAEDAGYRWVKSLGIED